MTIQLKYYNVLKNVALLCRLMPCEETIYLTSYLGIEKNPLLEFTENFCRINLRFFPA